MRKKIKEAEKIARDNEQKKKLQGRKEDLKQR